MCETPHKDGESLRALSTTSMMKIIARNPGNDWQQR